jgi:hypothetical protein
LPLVLALWLAGLGLALVARTLGVSMRGSLRAPLLVLLAALLAAPLSARVPELLRRGLAAGSALVNEASR